MAATVSGAHDDEGSALAGEQQFGARLAAALDARGPLCVGIDPHTALLEQWGLGTDVDGLARFADRCVEAFARTAAVIKPQSAFFEVFGARGVAVLERTIAACRDAGALVLLDVKRGDIGSTMAAYARAYLAPDAPMSCDAMTVSPFLGVGSLQPAFDLAAAHGRGVFVLALTSNPEGPDVQHARGADGRSVAGAVLAALADRNGTAAPMGPFGAVVGATIADAPVGPAELAAVHGPLLVPGIGAQGGTPDDVRRVFGDALPAVVPSVSREVLRGGPEVAGLRAAAERQLEAFAFLRAR